MADMRPARKVAKEANDMLARPKGNPAGITKQSYPRKDAGNAQASKGTYVRKDAGITPDHHNVNRSAGDAFQPNRKSGAQNMSKVKKGAD